MRETPSSAEQFFELIFMKTKVTFKMLPRISYHKNEKSPYVSNSFNFLKKYLTLLFFDAILPRHARRERGSWLTFNIINFINFNIKNNTINNHDKTRLEIKEKKSLRLDYDQVIRRNT